MAAHTVYANLLLSLATRTSHVLLRLDRCAGVGYEALEHSHMVALRWNELCAVWEF